MIIAWYQIGLLGLQWVSKTRFCRLENLERLVDWKTRFLVCLRSCWPDTSDPWKGCGVKLASSPTWFPWQNKSSNSALWLVGWECLFNNSLTKCQGANSRCHAQWACLGGDLNCPEAQKDFSQGSLSSNQELWISNWLPANDLKSLVKLS